MIEETELKAIGVTPEEIRLRCLELALGVFGGKADLNTTLQNARIFSEFVQASTDKRPECIDDKE